MKLTLYNGSNVTEIYEVDTLEGSKLAGDGRALVLRLKHSESMVVLRLESQSEIDQVREALHVG